MSDRSRMRAGKAVAYLPMDGEANLNGGSVGDLLSATIVGVNRDGTVNLQVQRADGLVVEKHAVRPGVFKGQWTRAVPRVLPAPVSNVLPLFLPLYVTTTGSDTADGSRSSPFRTVQRAFDRVDELIVTRPKLDIVIIGAGDHSDEDILWNPPVQPQRRIILKADRLGMTVLTSGTLTGGNSNSVTDTGASWGATNQYAGKVMRLRNPAGVETHNFTIRSHTGTVARPCQSFTVAPGAGWTYQILEPSFSVRSFKSSLPWISPEGFNVFAKSRAPSLVFMWTRFGPPPGLDAVLQFKGGEVGFIGCEARGAGGTQNGIISDCTAVSCGEIWGSGQADPALDNAVADDFDFTYLAGLHIFDGFNAIAARNVGAVQGFPVCTNGGFLFGVGQVAYFIRGGAIHGSGGGIEIQGNAYMQLDGGFESALAFLIKGNGGAYAVRCKLDSYLEIGNGGLGGLELDTISGDAFLCEQHAEMRIRSIAASGGVTGRGVAALTAANVRVDAGVSFATTGANLQADDTTATFAALTPSAPVLGTSVLSGARIWEG